MSQSTSLTGDVNLRAWCWNTVDMAYNSIVTCVKMCVQTACMLVVAMAFFLLPVSLQRLLLHVSLPSSLFVHCIFVADSDLLMSSQL